MARNPVSRLSSGSLGGVTDRARRPPRFQLFGEVIAELKKVTWPTGRQAYRLTVLVIAISVTIGAILGSIDLGFARFFEQLL